MITDFIICFATKRTMRPSKSNGKTFYELILNVLEIIKRKRNSVITIMKAKCNAIYEERDGSKYELVIQYDIFQLQEDNNTTPTFLCTALLYFI